MRAKFVIRIHPDGDGIFPTDEEFSSRLVKLGLGAVDAEDTYELNRKRHIDLAGSEWEHLPDAAGDEKDRIIFFAVYPGHERLVVTRRSEGYVTFRIIHYALGELERTAERLINQLTLRHTTNESLEVVDGMVEIYERGVERIIIVGGVIANPLKTAARRNTATVVAAATTLTASITSLVLLATLSLEPGTTARGTLERFSTAMMATFFVGLIQFLQSWWQLRKRGDIEWDPVELAKSR